MDYYGFEKIEFKFGDRNAILVLADQKNRTTKWTLKTEYFGAFENTQVALLENGYNLAYLSNETRWCKDSDLEAKSRFVDYLSSKYKLEGKCSIIGMSCGGMIGVKFASRYPEKVSVLYLDAPVMNFLSCPAGLGNATDSMMNEFTQAMGMNIKQLISYRENPIDVMHKLLNYDIPVILVAGDSDKTVPYDENGIFIDEMYRKNNKTIETHIKKGCDHHPHGLDDPTPIINFIIAHTE